MTDDTAGAGWASDGPIVVKVGGRGVADAAHRSAVARAIAAVHGGGSDGGGCGVVLVHGGGSLVDEHFGRLGVETSWVDGLRVSPARDMPEIAAVLAGKVNSMLVAGLIALGVGAVGMRLGDGCSLDVTRSRLGGGALGEVGVVAGGEGRLIRVLLDAGYLPVVCSLGIAGDGTLLNVNADDAAMGVARALGAGLVVFLTDVPGILDARGGLIERVTPGQIEGLIEEGVISGGMIPKARAAAAGAIGRDTIIASYEDPAALSGLARGGSVGTRVVRAAGANRDQINTPTTASRP